MRSAIAAAPALARSDARLVVRHGDLAPSSAIARAMRMACSRAGLTICASRAIADDLGPVGRVEIVHPGVDLERFRPPEALPPDGPVLLLGAIVDWKRPDLALEAHGRPARGAAASGRGAVLDAGGRAARRPARASRAARPGGARGVRAGPPTPPRPGAARPACFHCADSEPLRPGRARGARLGRPVVAPAAGGPAELVDDERGQALPRPATPTPPPPGLVEVLGDREPRGQARAGGQAPRRSPARPRERGRALARGRDRSPPPHRKRRAARDSPGHGHRTTPSASWARCCAPWSATCRPPSVLVVDSASSDGSVAVARGFGERVRRCSSSEDNVGFGTAQRTRGVEAVSEPVVAIVATPTWSCSTLRWPSWRPRWHAPTGRSGSRPRLVLLPGRLPPGLRPPAAGDRARPRSLARAPGRAAAGRSGCPLAPWRRARARGTWAGPVGCCLVARTETLRRLGPFRRATSSSTARTWTSACAPATPGVETWFWPAARVLHRHGHATRRDGERFELCPPAPTVVERRLGTPVAAATTPPTSPSRAGWRSRPCCAAPLSASASSSGRFVEPGPDRLVVDPGRPDVPPVPTRRTPRAGGVEHVLHRHRPSGPAARASERPLLRSARAWAMSRCPRSEARGTGTARWTATDCSARRPGSPGCWAA